MELAVTDPSLAGVPVTITVCPAESWLTVPFLAMLTLVPLVVFTATTEPSGVWM
jgi:hypothetical protein